ncbi:hypothetical protein SAMN05660420_02338 [Desulfuromusa kysingii]|uniref:Uncharacterized protein n=1 Tax=Desulfuromusa kysingii TaxID=37625 RepID=A0A1H4BYH5_9BACT|nr:hypothetical protein [Desulfuromusa kysingii]SEA53134.1 hypothetical protein SAMN05660420_02338 [Desulfuromusa kysingii]
MNDKNNKFQENICKVLDHSLNDLGVGIDTKLGRLKYRALSSVESEKHWRPFWGSVFMAASLLFIVLFNFPQGHRGPLTSPDFTDLDLLTAEESLEFYAEDIEFYEWLSEIMESDPTLIDEAVPVPANTHSQLPDGWRGGRKKLAQSGIDRVSWNIRG